MQRRCILALDQGTTSSRAILFDHAGKVISLAQREFPQHYPQPGWVEHDPMDIWSSQTTVAAEAITRANRSTDDIAAVGITNQRETVIVWDRLSGDPVYPAIVWQDRRTAAACQQMAQAGLGPLFAERTGLRLDPYFSGTKIAWILDNVPGARARAEAGQLLCGTVDSWLIWKLTNGRVHCTDVSNASRTLLLNIHTLAWDQQLLDILQIPACLLPEVRSSSEVVGRIAANLFPGGVPISGIAGDQQAALFGQACFLPGMAKNTYGTGCFLLMHTGQQPVVSRHNLLTTVAWRINGVTEYALEGSVFIGGAVIQWLRDELGIIPSAADCDRLAATVPNTAGLFIVPAFSGLGAPHWDPHARGTIIGITRGTNRAHLCRAALDSIALQVFDLCQCMEADSAIHLRELRVDGGAARSDLLMQLQSDLLACPVVRPACVETTALGAAYLAGLAVGFWRDRAEIGATWQENRRFRAQEDTAAVAAKVKNWHRAIGRSTRWTESGYGD